MILKVLIMKLKKAKNTTLSAQFETQISERGKTDAPNRQIHDLSLSWLSTGTSIKSGVVKLVHGPRLPIFAK